jgi:hypothetical protein
MISNLLTAVGWRISMGCILIRHVLLRDKVKTLIQRQL